MLSIGEVAKKLNLPVHTIRYWTQTFGHIKVSTINGRRYYDESAVEELKKIKELEYKKGLKIDGIKQMLRYHKIDMDKMEKANKSYISSKIDEALKIIDRQLTSCCEDNIDTNSNNTSIQFED